MVTQIVAPPDQAAAFFDSSAAFCRLDSVTIDRLACLSSPFNSSRSLRYSLATMFSDATILRRCSISFTASTYKRRCRSADGICSGDGYLAGLIAFSYLMWALCLMETRKFRAIGEVLAYIIDTHHAVDGLSKAQ